MCSGEICKYLTVEIDSIRYKLLESRMLFLYSRKASHINSQRVQGGSVKTKLSIRWLALRSLMIFNSIPEKQEHKHSILKNQIGSFIEFNKRNSIQSNTQVC